MARKMNAAANPMRQRPAIIIISRYSIVHPDMPPDFTSLHASVVKEPIDLPEQRIRELRLCVLKILIQIVSVSRRLWLRSRHPACETACPPQASGGSTVGRITASLRSEERRVGKE